MKIIQKILEAKTTCVAITIAPDATVYQAIEILAKENLGALVVVKNQKVCGIVSERDYARKIVLKGRSSKETLVNEIMTKDVLYVSPSDSVDKAMVLMIQKFIRHLPVLEDSKLIGVISIGDVVRSVIDEKQFAIEELEKYIHG